MTVTCFNILAALTKDVDLTITNILEGRVHFTPIEPPTAATPTSTHWHKSSSSTVSIDCDFII